MADSKHKEPQHASFAEKLLLLKLLLLSPQDSRCSLDFWRTQLPLLWHFLQFLAVRGQEVRYRLNLPSKMAICSALPDSESAACPKPMILLK
ncbi:hypothetical protein BBD42_18505 [Paenibacillus sp. BIHB 4019]|uniref:Uncharacterized protein n=1 Tax=Paenibacillus sp. BIHB 4019 TaxID=1870819 RepID=A0A1B2DKN5_9BACL|nr:hypothetical protein BBD42_18505 [Paenibacillus sp. BIHB 4019]